MHSGVVPDIIFTNLTSYSTALHNFPIVKLYSGKLTGKNRFSINDLASMCGINHPPATEAMGDREEAIRAPLDKMSPSV